MITDRSYRFDEIASGHEGPLFLEIVPLSFAVEVREKLTLAQLRLSLGSAEIDDSELRRLHAETGLLYRGGRPVTDSQLATANGIFLGLDLRGDDQGRVGYRAKKNTPVLDASKVRGHGVGDFWDVVTKDSKNRIILDPESFYLLMSDERIRIPPSYAAEMTAYDPTSGELRNPLCRLFRPRLR